MSATPEPPLGELQLIDPELYARAGYPHEAWRRLRREAPLHRFQNGPIPYWAVTRHADITAVGKNPDLFRSSPRLIIRREDAPEVYQATKTLIEQDNPKHRRYRKLISGRFTPRALRKIHADVDRIARRIVDELLEQGDEGEVDFVEKVAAPLPIAVIAWLLGVPESDWRLLYDWTNRTIGADDPELHPEGVDGSEDADRATRELYQYFAGLVEEKRRRPADDLVTLFAHAEIDGERLPPLDVLAYCQIIVVAGNETTRNATSGGMLALIEHPAERHRLQAEPALLESALEEILRWTSPIIHFARTAAQDTQLAGVRIREGDALALFYPSANRDEAVFDAPDAFRIDRHPNRHLAFGVGEHFCAGAHVARLELEMAFKYLLPRLADVELAGPVDRLRSNLVGGVKRLPIRYKLRPS